MKVRFLITYISLIIFHLFIYAVSFVLYNFCIHFLVNLIQFRVIKIFILLNQVRLKLNIFLANEHDLLNFRYYNLNLNFLHIHEVLKFQFVVFLILLVIPQVISPIIIIYINVLHM